MAGTRGISRREHEMSEELVRISPDICKFAIDNKMSICQVGRHRTFGPLFEVDHQWMPEKGSEVYIGRLPRDCYEPELVPFLEQVAPIHQLRLLVKSDGTTYGYGFATFLDPVQAEKAASLLNGINIREGYPIQVAKCIERTSLLLKGIPTNQSLKEIHAVISNILFGVVKVELMWAMDNVEHPTGQVLVTFYNYRAASSARRKIFSGNLFRDLGWDIVVNWSEKIPNPDAEYERSIQTDCLFVSGLIRGTSWKALWNHLESLEISGIKFVEISKKGHCASITFHKIKHARKAKVVLDISSFQGKKLHVEWKKNSNMENEEAVGQQVGVGWVSNPGILEETVVQVLNGNEKQVVEQVVDEVMVQDGHAVELAVGHAVGLAAGQAVDEVMGQDGHEREELATDQVMDEDHEQVVDEQGNFVDDGRWIPQVDQPNFQQDAEQFYPMQVMQFVPMYMMSTTGDGSYIPLYMGIMYGIPMIPVVFQPATFVPNNNQDTM